MVTHLKILKLISQNGQQAYEARDYLVEQEGCDTVTLDSQTFYGPSHPDHGKNPKELKVEL